MSSLLVDDLRIRSCTRWHGLFRFDDSIGQL